MRNKSLQSFTARESDNMPAKYWKAERKPLGKENRNIALIPNEFLL